MQKRSETVYSSLFWLISGLVVWLVIVPVTLICFPVVILVKVAGHVLLQMPPQANPEGHADHAPNPLVTTLLLTALIEVPALLAAFISLQPTRLVKGDRRLTQTLEPHPTTPRGKSAPEAIEISAEEKASGT